MPNCSSCLSIIDYLKVVVTTTWKCEVGSETLEKSVVGWECPKCGKVLFSEIEQENQAREFLRG